MNRDSLLKLLATGFYSGYSPILPGTAGTAVAMLCAGVWYHFLPQTAALVPSTILAVVIAAVAVWVTKEVLEAQLLGDLKDPQTIVVDEFAGYAAAVVGIGHSATGLLWAFLLFRVFDILKPPPIGRIERLQGAYGVVLDDVFAGFLTAFSLRILDQMFHIL